MLEYTVKGQSIINKDFIIPFKNKIYILDYKGKTKSTIDFSNFNNLDWEVYLVNEIFPSIYSCLIINEVVHQGLLIIFKNINDKIQVLKEYKFINSFDNSDLILDMHCYYLKSLDDCYLYAINSILIDDPYLNSKVLFDNEIIQEQKDDKIVWQWETKDHYLDFINYSIKNNYNDFNNTNRLVPAHINYFCEFNNNSLLVSFRHLGIALLDKPSGNLLWIVGQNKNDLNFKYLPKLQHCICFLDNNKTKFATFNNNWLTNINTKNFITNNKILDINLIESLNNSSIITYDLENKISKAYNTGIIASPREGNIIYLKENIFDINYGCYIKNEYNFNLGLVQEKDIITDKIYFEIYLNYDVYNISRGL